MQSEGRSFDPDIDLLRRYESMIRIQVETIDGIDEKAAVTARLTTMLVGLVMTAASILLTTTAAVLTRETVVPLVMFGFGLVFLLAALLFAIITYLSSSFRYGPSAAIGRYMATHQITTQDYTSTLLDGYSGAIDQNRAVVRANAVRFKWSLASLLAGVIFVVLSGALYAVPLGPGTEVGIALAGVGIAAFLLSYVVREEYLTLRAER